MAKSTQRLILFSVTDTVSQEEKYKQAYTSTPAIHTVPGIYSLYKDHSRTCQVGLRPNHFMTKTKIICKFYHDMAITMHEKHDRLCRHEKAYWIMFIMHMVIHEAWFIGGGATTRMSCPAAAAKKNGTVGWPSFLPPAEEQHLLPSHSWTW